MHRFFCPELPGLSEPGAAWQGVNDIRVNLDSDETRHGRRVLRLEAGAEIEVFNGQGTVGKGIVESWDGRAAVRMASICQVAATLPRVTIAVCLPKGPRADQLIEQLSQLGVDRVIPLRTARSVVDPRDSKMQRFRRACIESAKQCDRAWLMEVADVMDFDAVLREPAAVRLIADVTDKTGATSKGDSVLVLIGPEGGWTEQERQAAGEAGFAPWRLGPHVMRIETAAAAAAAIIRHAAEGPP